METARRRTTIDDVSREARPRRHPSRTRERRSGVRNKYRAFGLTIATAFGLLSRCRTTTGSRNAPPRNNKREPKKSRDPDFDETSLQARIGGFLHDVERNVEREMDYLFHNGEGGDGDAVPGEPLSTSELDPYSDLRSPAWTTLREKIIERDGNSEKRPRFLVGWPTIPVSQKGSDSRCLDAILFLTKLNFSVDLIFWRDFSTERNDPTYDDTKDRRRLEDAGVELILGPYDATPSGCTPHHVDVSGYHAFLFSLWPDGPYLNCVVDWTRYVKKKSGSTKVIAMVDDIGVAVRNLYAGKTRAEMTVKDAEDFLLRRKRHPDLLGTDDEGGTAKLGGEVNGVAVDSEADYLSVRSPVYLFQLEMFLYVMADLTVGLNQYISQFLTKIAPGTPSLTLSYISPVQPDRTQKTLGFEDRNDYVFFGYNNPANERALEWVHTDILNLIDSRFKLHIAGMVHPPKELCACDKSYQNCQSRVTNVICHGPLSDQALEQLIRSSRAAINPVLEPSGVATKTCRAMAYGTPVVATDLDGTFSLKTARGAKICKSNDAQCMARSLNELLSSKTEWNRFSLAAMSFIPDNYGFAPYAKDWHKILDLLSDRPIEIVIDGDAKFEGESMQAQNWHLAKTLSQNSRYRITVMGNLNPTIHNVITVAPPSEKPTILSSNNNDGTWPLTIQTYPSPFPTGFQANIIIRQKWPPSFPSLPLKYCGEGCRVVQILPWEFGYLPKKWIKSIQTNIDWLWAPSEYNRQIFSKSGIHPSRTAVTPAGIDCRSLDRVPPSHKPPTSPIVFLFTGGLLPRKGVDILIQEFTTLFCNLTDIALKIHTSYELGYAPHEIHQMQSMVDPCTNIQFIRQKWMSRQSHLDMMAKSDVYIAPFRSEGFGLPIVEAMILNMTVIAPVGGTAADDYLHKHARSHRVYAVQSEEQKCRHLPCQQNSICVFEPCKQDRHGEWKCSCEELVDTPTWVEIDRKDLRIQMRQAFRDAIGRRAFPEDDEVAGEDNPIRDFCWDRLGDVYAEQIETVLRGERMRNVQPYLFVSPDSIKRYIKIRASQILLVFGVLVLIGNHFYFYKKGVHLVNVAMIRHARYRIGFLLRNVFSNTSRRKHMF